MAMIGHATQRFVAYPISKVDDNCSLPEINWIAELTFDSSIGWKKDDWNREAKKKTFYLNLKIGNLIGWMCLS